MIVELIQVVICDDIHAISIHILLRCTYSRIFREFVISQSTITLDTEGKYIRNINSSRIVSRESTHQAIQYMNRLCFLCYRNTRQAFMLRGFTEGSIHAGTFGAYYILCTEGVCKRYFLYREFNYRDNLSFYVGKRIRNLLPCFWDAILEREVVQRTVFPKWRGIFSLSQLLVYI